MAFIKGDHERLSVHLAVCRTRLQQALRIIKHCPSLHDQTWAAALLDQTIFETLGTLEHVEQHILTPSIGE